jgi:hypothetical protein
MEKPSLIASVGLICAVVGIAGAFALLVFDALAHRALGWPMAGLMAMGVAGSIVYRLADRELDWWD